MENKAEIWKAHPEYAGIEVSTLGGVRTLDRVTSSEDRTWFTKGRVLKQRDNGKGYLMVNILVDEKWINKSVHRLVAQTFIKNTDNFPQVNHKDNNRTNNNVSNLEWCDNSYNQKYREKHGISQAESLGHPVFAVNLTTLKVSKYRSQREASRELGVHQANVNNVIRGRYKQTGGYWLTNDDGHKDAWIKQKIAEEQRVVEQTINDLTSQLEAAKQRNNDLSQAIEDAQSIKDYSDNAVKSVSTK